MRQCKAKQSCKGGRGPESLPASLWKCLVNDLNLTALNRNFTFPYFNLNLLFSSHLQIDMLPLGTGLFPSMKESYQVYFRYQILILCGVRIIIIVNKCIIRKCITSVIYFLYEYQRTSTLEWELAIMVDFRNR